MAASQQLTNWYAGQQPSNGISQTGGIAPDPATALPTTNSSAPITPETTTSVAPKANTVASTYTGLKDANTQLSDPAKWTITPEQTVQGQLSGILNSGSPLMQQAKTTGLQTANARGLLNSSLAAGAAENAMIGSATPIATSDANVNAASAQANQNVENAFKTTNASNAFNAGEKIYSTETAAAVNAANNLSTEKINLSGQISTMNNSLNNDIATIQTNPNMTQQAKQYSIKQLQDAYKSQVTMLSAVGDVPDVSALLVPIPGTENPKEPKANAVFGPPPAPQPKGGKVICTYYHSIGFMADSIYDRDCAYGQMLNKTNPDLKAWYLSWAVDFVKVLQNNPKLTWIAWPFVDAWSKEMAYQMGGLKKGNILGKSIMFIGDVCCHIMKPLKHKGEVICQK